MTIGFKQMQTQQLQQRLIMTPKLQQAIKVLLMSRMDLTQHLSQQLQQNPLLEEGQDEEIDISELNSADELDPDTEWNEPEESLDRADTEPDIDWENCFDDMISLSERAAFEHWANDDQPQSDIAELQTLQEFLMAQLSVAPFSDVERKIGEQIIGNLDDNGQLKVTLLLSIDLKFQSDLDDGDFSESLRQEIEDGGILISQLFSVDFEAYALDPDDPESFIKNLRRLFEENGTPLQTITVGRRANNQWLITDVDDKQTYLLQKDGDKLSIYQPQNVTITVKDKDGRWLIIDDNNKQTYTVKKKEEKLDIYNITLEDIAEGVGCEVDDVEDVLRFIQRNFEPTGIAYRTIPETLLVQMGAAQIDSPLAQKILENHLDDLMNNLVPRIAQKLEVKIDAVLEAKELIGTLDPYPGRHFSDPSDPKRFDGRKRTAGLIIPDVTVENSDGEYRFITNDDGMPRLRLSPFYVDMMRNGASLDKKAKEWLENYKSQAVDLLKSIDQRRQTIKKVTEAIFEVQADFLEQGVKGLKPLVLRQIADMAGVHESTVSRVTTNKYVETPQGIYRLKFFFSGELPTDFGDNVSATSVKEKIKGMIEKEDLAKPLSDQVISGTLKTQGINAARRTVAKYREELGILSSSKRKQKW